MKTNVIILSLVLLVVGSIALEAQSLRIGYTNTDYILSKLPEAKQIESELKTHRDQLGAQLKSKQEEFERKYQSFIDGQATMTDVVKNDVQAELQGLQQSIKKRLSMKKLMAESKRWLKKKDLAMFSLTEYYYMPLRRMISQIWF